MKYTTLAWNVNIPDEKLNQVTQGDWNNFSMHKFKVDNYNLILFPEKRGQKFRYEIYDLLSSKNDFHAFLPIIYQQVEIHNKPITLSEDLSAGDTLCFVDNNKFEQIFKSVDTHLKIPEITFDYIRERWMSYENDKKEFDTMRKKYYWEIIAYLLDNQDILKNQIIELSDMFEKHTVQAWSDVFMRNFPFDFSHEPRLCMHDLEHINFAHLQWAWNLSRTTSLEYRFELLLQLHSFITCINSECSNEDATINRKEIDKQWSRSAFMANFVHKK